jgi:hypothetical protein
LFAFLTTDPNSEVGAIHPKAMPVILRTMEETDIWMTEPAGWRCSCSGRCRMGRWSLSPAARSRMARPLRPEDVTLPDAGHDQGTVGSAESKQRVGRFDRHPAKDVWQAHHIGGSDAE